MSQVVHLESIDDERLVPYRQVKERELLRDGGRFIAEGEFVVRRLLASPYPCESVLSATRKATGIAPLLPVGVPLYVLPEKLVNQLLGFRFHSGVMAVGRRLPDTRLDVVLANASPRSTIVVCPDLTNLQNMGSMIRVAAGFGADAIVLGERCADPYYRLAIRVSMGTIFSLPVVRCENLFADLMRLKTQFGYELVATVLDASAQPLDQARRGGRLALLFGNEGDGLNAEHISICDRQVTIPMQRGTDSLNVASAAGVFMYHFTRPECFIA